jgi:predicted ATPase/class 3 adenylate cyclase
LRGRPALNTSVFLFSDIEGSTRRWEQYPAAMQDALRRHDEVMRAAIAAHGGTVFKTIGDAFCAVFPTAPAAVAAARDAQRALGAGDFEAIGGLRVRMAIHAGSAEERDDDYFGPTVNRVARLLAAGHGGQVLVSGVAADLSEGLLPDGVELLDLGTHRLKDLTAPERVKQLRGDAFGETFPALRSLDAFPNNLPLQLTGLVGRSDELGALRERLASARLVSLVGSGGIGKTRIALQAAAETLEAYADGVWLVELAPLAEESAIADALAAVLGLVSGRSPLESVVAHLREKRALVVLDNCEHLLLGAARVADALLRGCTGVTILATTREPLGIPGEAVYRLPSLAVPPAGKTLTADAAASFGAVALFVERAAAQTTFALSDETAPIVADICRRLDGIPLAIELAASRVKLLSVKQLNERLGERFRILTGGSRTSLPRQQTMRALIDWSYELLSEDERALLRRVAAFAGGWTLEAASEVAGDERLAAWEILDLLGNLVDKSMAVADDGKHERRYSFLETIREYARERLAESGERDEIERKHAAYYATLAERSYAEQDVAPPGSREWALTYGPEIDNFRLALAWGLGENREPPFAAALAGALFPLFERLGFNVEFLRVCEATLAAARGGLPPEVEARALYGMALLSYSVEPARMETLLDRAIALFRALNDRLHLARALRGKAGRLARTGRGAAGRAAAAEALAVARELGEKREIAISLEMQALAFDTSEIAEARRAFAEGIALLGGAEGDDIVARFYQWWGEAEFAAGEFARALEAGRHSLAAFEAQGAEADVAMQLTNVAGYALALDDLISARDSVRAAIASAHDVQDDVDETYALQHAASLAAAEGHFDAAARIAGFVDGRVEALEIERYDTERYLYERLMKDLRGALDERELGALIEEGRRWPLSRAISEALAV